MGFVAATSVKFDLSTLTYLGHASCLIACASEADPMSVDGKPTREPSTVETNVPEATSEGASGRALPFEPDVPNRLVSQSNLTLTGFTLLRGEMNLELFAAVRNDGAKPACQPGMFVNLYDDAGYPLAFAGPSLTVGGAYRIVSNPDSVIACMGAGEVAMAATNELPPELTLDQVASMDHMFSYFELEVERVEGFGVSNVASFESNGGYAFTGTFINSSNTSVIEPRVTIFPLNEVGRPLGMARAQGTDAVAALGTWTFETNSVPDAGVSLTTFARAFAEP